MTPDPRSQPDLATENARLRSANAKLVEACRIALKQIHDLDDELNMPGHYVIGWHLNGQSEPVTSFFEDNDHGAAELLRAAIAEAEAQP